MSSPAEVLAMKKKRNPICKRRQKREVYKYPWVCKLRLHRKRLKLSMNDVVKGIGRKGSESWLCMVEKGWEVRLSSAMRLAKFFGASVEALWKLKKVK